MKYKTLTGYLRVTTDGAYWMQTGPHDYVEVFGAPPYVEVFGAPPEMDRIPVNKLITLSVSDEPNVYGKHRVSNEIPAHTLIKQPLGDQVPLKKHIGIYRLMPEGAGEELVAYSQIKVDEAARQVEIYLRTYARHLWDIEVKGFVFEGPKGLNTGPPSFASKYVDAVDTGNFKPNYFHVWGGSGTMCGLAYMGNNRSCTFTNNDCGVRTIVHEIFHNLKVGHAGAIKVNAESTEYGDQSCIMGAIGVGVRGLNSPHMMTLGLDTDREIKIVESDTAIWVAPIEMPAHGMHEQESQHIVIRTPGEKDVVASTRKTKGWPYPQPANLEGVVYLHEVSGATTKLLEPTMRKGDTRTLPNGARVAHLGSANEAALITVRFPDDNSEFVMPDTPLGFPTNIKSAYIDAEHQGVWWDPDFKGQGLSIHVVGNQLQMTWFTFNQNDDCRRYYFGGGELIPNPNAPGFLPIEFSLYSTTGGTFDNPSRYDEYKVGSAQLYFLNDRTGVFNYNTSKHGRGSIEIEPTALSDDSGSGMYFEPENEGSGFSIQFLENDRISASWYTYGPKPPRPPMGTREVQDQRWYSCEGSKQPDGAYALTIYEVIDGRFMHLQEAEILPVGDATLDVQPDGRIAFGFNMSAMGVIEDDVYILERL